MVVSFSRAGVRAEALAGVRDLAGPEALAVVRAFAGDLAFFFAMLLIFLLCYQFRPAGLRNIDIMIWTVFTSIAAAISSFQVIFLREDHQSLFIVIELHSFPELVHSFVMVCCSASGSISLTFCCSSSSNEGRGVEGNVK